MAKLTSKQRNAMPQSEFALPGGRYPINDPNHARNALSRVSQYGSPDEKSRVRSRVHERYPSIGHMADGGIIGGLITMKPSAVGPPNPERPMASNSDRDYLSRIEDMMRQMAQIEQAGRAARYPDPSSDDAHLKMQRLAEEGMRMRHLKRYEEGGVVGGGQQDTSPWPIWGKFLDMMFKGPTRTLHSAGGAPPPPPPQNQDISIVKKAAEEAGKRNEAEQALARTKKLTEHQGARQPK